MSTTARSNVTLIRGLGVFAAISIVVGSVIGTGIFLKTRVMMCNVETPGLVITAWIAAGLLSLAGALTYAELAAMMPRAGGEYVFMREAYGPRLAFLYGWTQFSVAYTGSQAAKGVSFAIFLNSLLGGTLDGNYFTLRLFGYDFPFGHLQVVALVMIILATLVNCMAVSVSGKISVVLTGIKILLVLAVGVGAFVMAGTGDWAHFGMSGAAGTCEGVEATARAGLAGFGAAMLGALWAYDGWSNVTIVAGEVKNPQRNLPLALIGGLLIVAALYIFANLAYLYVLSPVEIASVSKSSSVATEVVQRFLGPTNLRLAVSLIAMAMMISTLGSLHTGTLSGARISYAMARDRLFFQPLARLSPRTHVPVNALLVQGVWSCVLALSGSFDTLTDYVIFAAWIFYGMNTASVFIFRRRMPHAERPYRTLGYPVVPVLFLLVTLGLLTTTLIATPRQALIGLGIILLGLPIYEYWSRRNRVAFEQPPDDETI
ncbi:MAG TPA: amino acid permease [Pyrinomonadaceae bacterium]|jgi:APA family basic amino acid/polyamine antiporter|nr:amino acid permease [Pyrinomonadaceae bacterium]